MEDKLESFQYVIMKKMTEHFMRNPLDENDEETKEFVRNSIQKMYLEELKELKERFVVFKASSEDLKIGYVSEESQWIQQFKCNMTKNSDSRYIEKTPEISINEAWIYKKLSESSPNERINACKKIFYGVFHELRHYMQYLYMENGKYSEETMRIAREFAIADSGLADENFYKDNYGNFFIENDAKEFAHAEYKRIMLKDYSKKEPERETSEKEQEDKKAKIKEMDEIEKSIIDDLIVNQGKTDLLHMYPIMQNEYNLDGTKKIKEEQVEERNQEI